MLIQNISHIFASRLRLLAYVVLVVLASLLWWTSTNVHIMFGNYGALHTWTDIVLSVIMILGFPLFLVGFYYKSHYFGTHVSGSEAGGFAGGIIATIISGASCCGATLAASFGLLPLMSFLPWSGLEIKIIATLGLLYALYDLLRNLETCRIKTPKNRTK